MPTKLKALMGNPGRRPLNRQEPQPVGRPKRPDYVTGEAAQEWDRVIASMPDGLYTGADSAVLAVYCGAWVLFRNALAQAAKEGITITNPQGAKVVHPAVVVQAKPAEILRAADRLGMSPSARSRLTMSDVPDGPSKFDGLLGGAQLRLVASKPREGPPAA